ncbi:hypothetical protein FPV21_01850 [Carnobacterium sp. PL12RED10]|uniref:hypothetical protein n=1 Tax=Carnobacterium sp. PL12RED10 TaxID=2592351 RepID=UPI0011EC1F04|nr:hypothetical protein [Carnobacterium sp. PL12RED10]KAF3302249.1 hypothetical protein FPV21_01850 [Carnobacterium sp. PL12RED10]
MKFEHVLFLWFDKESMYPAQIAKRGVEVGQVYVNQNRVAKFIRNLHIISKLPGVDIWFDDWKKNINNYKVVIVQDSILSVPVVSYLNKYFPNIKIIVWYWNTVETTISVDEFKKFDCEIWTFDHMDAEKFGLKWNNQYYFNNISLPNKETEQDIYFVGRDKGRLENLLKFGNKLENMNISYRFHISSDNFKSKNTIYSKPISYPEVLDDISKSKAILDIVQSNQTGLTLRPLEALFFEKKLITNDKSIANYDFYDERNIFIIGINDINNIYEFVNTPYHKISNDIVNKYDFDSWLKNILNKLS